MTSDTHERASDRCAEALLMLEKDTATKYDIVVMVQGDEPMTHPKMIEEAVRPLLNRPEIQVANLLGEIKDSGEFEDRNCIKVVCDLASNASIFHVNQFQHGAKSITFQWANKYALFLFVGIFYWSTQE